MNIFVAIDSFKGSMTSEEANQVVKNTLQNQHNIETFPIADGGEGTVDSFVNLMKGSIISAPITGPNGKTISGKFGWIKSEKLAIIEVAEGAGITKVTPDTLDPRKHTSYGVGEQILMALDLGAKEIIIGLGGSATVDGGIGLLQAIGVQFFDQMANKLGQLPIDLAKIGSLETSEIDPRLTHVKITVASDVTNPLCGPDGATYIFGKQKGLREEELASYDKAMQNYQMVVNQTTATTMQNEPGAGAAGGIGFALYSFLPTTFQSGFELLAQKGELASKIEQADIVITGEGKFDRQSMHGKVPVGISRMAKQVGVPTILFTGAVEGHILDLSEENIVAIIPIIDEPMSLAQAMESGPKLLGRAVKRTFQLLNLSKAYGIFSDTQ